MGVMSLPASSRNMCSNMFLVFGFLISACSAKSPLPDISPLYPFNGGNSFKPTPFAPANDQAWINMMWWKSLAGKPVESAPGRVDPYDDGPHSFNQYLLDRLTEGTVPGITPGAYQKWTQYSNPAADYIGYGLFSNPLGHKGNTPPLGSTLFQPGNDLFWLMQFLQAQHRTPGGPIVVDYRDWYENTYLPWYEQWDQKMAEYKLQMMAYEAAQYQQLVPSNPFGPVSFGNPYPFYSKSAYKQSLFDDVAGSADPAVTYKDDFEDWKP